MAPVSCQARSARPGFESRRRHARRHSSSSARPAPNQPPGPRFREVLAGFRFYFRPPGAAARAVGGRGFCGDVLSGAFFSRAPSPVEPSTFVRPCIPDGGTFRQSSALAGYDPNSSCFSNRNDVFPRIARIHPPVRGNPPTASFSSGWPPRHRPLFARWSSTRLFALVSSLVLFRRV